MSKREISDKDADLQNRKKKRRKKLLYWLAIDLSVAFIIFALLLYKPGRYKPVDSPEISESNEDEVSPFLLKITSEVNNKAPLGKPFEVVVTQEAINDIINRAGWPMESDGIILDAPAALIVPDSVVLMGTARFQGIEFIITLELNAKINEEGRININVQKIKVGAVNITPLAKIAAKKMYAERFANIGDIDSYTWQSKVAASLLNEESFDPAFEIGNKTVSVDKITIEEGKLTIYMVPKK